MEGKTAKGNHELGALARTLGQFRENAIERERLERQGFKPTPRLLAKALSVRVKDIIEMESRLSAKEISLDVPVIEGDRERLVDLLPTDRPDNGYSVAAGTRINGQ